MSHELTHASFFSGVGGLDLGLERAGFRTVSFSEIDPYASAVLAERWPGVPNLGDIVALAGRTGDGQAPERPRDRSGGNGLHGGRDGFAGDSADLWSGGFPCQDLSVAGKRRGMGAGTRSGLAYAFLDLVAVHRPRAVLLENVPGLLSSHGGRDMAALLGALVELGYGVGYRVLDARYFGVPQRRRRVFIVGLAPGGRASAERAAAVLSIGTRCDRHPPAGVKAGSNAAPGARPGVDIARTVVGTAGKRHDEDIDTLIPDIVGALNDLGHHGWTANAQSVASGHVIPQRSSPDTDRVRAADGLAGRLDDSDVAATLTAPDARHRVVDGKRQDGSRLDRIPITYRKATKAHNADDWERWEPDDTIDTLASNGATNAATAILGGQPVPDGDGLPPGLDSHRYRCCGNGVVSSVAEWIGLRLAAELA